jgi:Phorbol esters/diacylglycerol binding domain (C1 domain)
MYQLDTLQRQQSFPAVAGCPTTLKARADRVSAQMPPPPPGIPLHDAVVNAELDPQQGRNDAPPAPFAPGADQTTAPGPRFPALWGVSGGDSNFCRFDHTSLSVSAERPSVQECRANTTTWKEALAKILDLSGGVWDDAFPGRAPDAVARDYLDMVLMKWGAIGHGHISTQNPLPDLWHAGEESKEAKQEPAPTLGGPHDPPPPPGGPARLDMFSPWRLDGGSSGVWHPLQVTYPAATMVKPARSAVSDSAVASTEASASAPSSSADSAVGASSNDEPPADTTDSATGKVTDAGHHFSAKFFSTPTVCQVCRKPVWGVTKSSQKGAACSRCGTKVHIKCQEHADACTNEKDETAPSVDSTSNSEKPVAGGEIPAPPSAPGNDAGAAPDDPSEPDQEGNLVLRFWLESTQSEYGAGVVRYEFHEKALKVHLQTGLCEVSDLNKTVARREYTGPPMMMPVG